MELLACLFFQTLVKIDLLDSGFWSCQVDVENYKITPVIGFPCGDLVFCLDLCRCFFFFFPPWHLVTYSDKSYCALMYKSFIGKWAVFFDRLKTTYVSKVCFLMPEKSFAVVQIWLNKVMTAILFTQFLCLVCILDILTRMKITLLIIHVSNFKF